MKKLIIPLSLFLATLLFADATAPSIYPVTQWYSPEPGVPSETGAKLVDVIYVRQLTEKEKKDGGRTKCDGSSWANAFTDIQHAINAAHAAVKDPKNEMAEVWIAKGTYKHGSTIFLKPNVAVYGGFRGEDTKFIDAQGNEQTLPAEQEWTEKENSRVEYPEGDNNSPSQDHYKYLTPIGRMQRTSGNFVYIDGEGKYAVFNATNTDATALKRATLATLTIQNGLSSNALAGGGALYVLNYYLTISNCTFYNNQAMFSGGAIFNHDELYDRVNEPDNGGKGGNDEKAEENDEYLPSPFQNHLELFNCTFANNTAKYYGGAICNGDIIYNHMGNPNADGIGNQEQQEEPDSTIILRNCTLTKNKAMCGGAIYDNNGTVLTNCIIWDNEATKCGREMCLEKENEQIMIMCVVKKWTEVSESTGEYHAGVDNSSNGLLSHEYIITKDPKLGKLGDNGGNVPTCAVGSGSSAIGAGMLSEEALTDARGVIRPTHLQCKPTIGAYEYTTFNYTSNLNGTVNVWADKVDANGTKQATAELSVEVIRKWTKSYEYEWLPYWLSYYEQYWAITDKFYDENKMPKFIEDPYTDFSPTVYEYKWEKLNDDKEWETVYTESTKPNVLLMSNLTLEDSGRLYRCTVTDKALNKTITSKVAKITVVEMPEIKVTENVKKTDLEAYDAAITRDGVANADSKITIAVTAKGAKKLAYQWQYSEDNGATWTDIDKKENKTATSPTFVSDRLKDTDFNKLYRVAVTSKAIQNSAVVYYPEKAPYFKAEKLDKPTITEQPVDVKCADTENAEFTLKVTPTSDEDKYMKFVWEVRAVGSTKWKKVGTKQTLIIKKPKVKLSGNLYRCKVSNKGNPKNPVISDEVTLEVMAAAKFLKQPKLTGEAKKTVYIGDKISAKVEEAVGYKTKYQWQYTIDGKNWIDIAGATSNELSEADTSSIQLPEGKTSASLRIRCQAQSYDDNGNTLGLKVNSKVIKLTLNEPVAFEEYSFKRDEVDISVYDSDTSEGYDAATDTLYAYAGYPLEMTVDATGNKPKYQWEYSHNENDWEKVSTKKSFKTKLLDKSDAGYYRCSISNGGSKAFSKTFKLIVIPPMSMDSLSGFYVGGNLDGAYFDAIFIDAKNFRISFDDDRALVNTTYKWTRTSPTEGTFTMSYEYKGGSYSMSGTLTYDDDNNKLTGVLTDSATGTKMNIVIDDFEETSDSIPSSSNELNGNKMEFDELTVNFISNKTCNVVLPSSKILEDCSYTYKNNKNGVGTVKITAKVGHETYNLELALCYTKDSNKYVYEGIYTLEIVNDNGTRTVEVGELDN